MDKPLFSYRTEFERVKGDRYVMIPVEVTIRMDFEAIPVARVAVSENAQWFYVSDDRATGEFAAFRGEVLFVSGTRINALEGDEEETLAGLTDSHLQAYQRQRDEGLTEDWFAQYAPKYDDHEPVVEVEFDQRRGLKRAA